MNKNFISLYINSNEITDSQLNDIVDFARKFNYKNPYKIVKIIVDKYPLRLKGKISNLTSLARGYFMAWNMENKMRNISICEVKND